MAFFPVGLSFHCVIFAGNTHLHGYVLLFLPFIHRFKSRWKQQLSARAGMRRRENTMQKGKAQNYDYTKHISDSQNFLTKRQLIRKILNLSSITADDIVLEIGAGKGHLTEALCQVSGLVYSVEIDRKLYEHTRTKLSHLTNLKLIHGDFLKLSLPARGGYKVFANIPYFITTQIMDKPTHALSGLCSAALKAEGRPRPPCKLHPAFSELCEAFHEIRALRKAGPAHQKTGFHCLKACRPASCPQRRHHVVYPVAVLISILSQNSGQIVTDFY